MCMHVHVRYVGICVRTEVCTAAYVYACVAQRVWVSMSLPRVHWNERVYKWAHV